MADCIMSDKTAPAERVTESNLHANVDQEETTTSKNHSEEKLSESEESTSKMVKTGDDTESSEEDTSDEYESESEEKDTACQTCQIEDNHEDEEEDEGDGAEDSEDDEIIETREVGCGVDGPQSNPAADDEEDDDDEDEDDNCSDADEVYGLGSGDLEPASRLKLFQQATELQQTGKLNKALHLYLVCLKGLQQTNGFTFLPQCLRNVADIYFEKGELEKAIQFIQAEKLYYESALIDTSLVAMKYEGQHTTEQVEGDAQPEEEKPDALRADEYEKLAKLCLEKEQPQLALEYQGKATKLRQQVYGDKHPITAKSLDLFTIIYGEVGKQQYAESMQRAQSPLRNPTSDVQSQDTSESTEASDGTLGIRRRKPTEEVVTQAQPEQEDNNDDSQFDQYDGQSLEIQEQEEWLSKIILWVLFFLCIIALSAILFFLYCKIDNTSPSCIAWKADLHYYYMKMKYFFHKKSLNLAYKYQ